MDRITAFVRQRWLALFGCVVVLIALCLDARVGGLMGAGLAMGLVNINEDIIKYLIKQSLLDAAGGYKAQGVKSKTANYTVLAASDGSSTVFDNRGAAGAVTFTLPAVVAALAGVYYDFYGVADQTFTVTAAAGAAVAFNNAACASVACSTAGQKIGAHIRAMCDGTSWKLTGDSVGVTYTVA